MQLAHVGYVLTSSEFAAEKGSDVPFLFSVFADPVNIVLMVVTVAAFLGGSYFFMNDKRCSRLMMRIRAKRVDYEPLLPWIARLSLGIAFIGAGSARDLLTPAMPFDGLFGLIQVLVGFLLLAGFATFPAILVAIVLYVFAVTQDIYFLGNIDYLALMVALLFWGSTRPGVDDLLGYGLPKLFTRFKGYAIFVLRMGIGVAMGYLAIVEKFLNPHAMEAVVSRYDLTAIVPVSLEMWVFATGTIELLIAICLLIGFKTRLAAGMAAIVLTLSFFFFGEEVFAHVTLFGVMSILFVAGGGRPSVDYLLDKESC